MLVTFITFYHMLHSFMVKLPCFGLVGVHPPPIPPWVFQPCSQTESLIPGCGFCWLHPHLVGGLEHEFYFPQPDWG